MVTCFLNCFCKADARTRFEMALNDEYEVNQKLVEILQESGKGSRNLIALISAAYASASDDVLIKLMTDLRALVPLLDEWRKDAVQSILTLDWSSKSQDVVSQHSQLLVSIAAAHVCHLDAVLRVFVKKFLPSFPIPATESVEECDAKTSDLRTRLWDEAHKSVAIILDVVPTSRRLLMKILRDSYPFLKRHLIYLRDYSRNLLRVTSYTIDLRPDILRLIVDELVKLDTICSQEALEAAANESTASSSDCEIFHMEAGDSDGRQKYVNEIIDTRTKLDACMYNVFTHLSSMQNSDEEEKLSLYMDLLNIFEASVLPVFSSHHVQFLWFVYCSYDKKLWKHFLSWLWQHVQTPSIVSSIRQNAACYLASYLARAAYLNISLVTTYVRAWVDWIHSYISNQEGGGGKENAAVHSTFYSMCQAVFYVIVFRVKEILSQRNGHEFLKSLNLDRVVTCRLNPLKYCSEKVVVNFANVSRNYQFAFCYTVLERNRRSAFFEQRRTGVAPNQLVEYFFPFDPYLLPKSAEFVTSLYREYDEGSMDLGEQNSSTQTRSNGNDDVDDFLDGESMEWSPKPDSYDIMASTMREALFSYSISPGFKHG